MCVCGVLIAGERESVCVWRTDSWRGRECVCGVLIAGERERVCVCVAY